MSKLNWPQQPGVRNTYSAELGSRIGESVVAKAALATQLFDRRTRFGLLDEPNDLLFSYLYLFFLISVVLHGDALP